MYHTISKELLNFLDASPTCFHAVKNIADQLTENGFTFLNEKDSWELKPGGNYFTCRNGSSLIAFTIPEAFDARRWLWSALLPPLPDLPAGWLFLRMKRFL